MLRRYDSVKDQTKRSSIRRTLDVVFHLDLEKIIDVARQIVEKLGSKIVVEPHVNISPNDGQLTEEEYAIVRIFVTALNQISEFVRNDDSITCLEILDIYKVEEDDGYVLLGHFDDCMGRRIIIRLCEVRKR